MTHIQPAPPLVRKPWPRATDAASLRDLDRNSTWNLLQRMAEELEAQNTDRECKQEVANTPQREGEESPTRRIPEKKMPENIQEAWKAAGLTGKT